MVGAWTQESPIICISMRNVTYLDENIDTAYHRGLDRRRGEGPAQGGPCCHAAHLHGWSTQRDSAASADQSTSKARQKSSDRPLEL